MSVLSYLPLTDYIVVLVQVFQEPLERPDQRGGPILSHEDIKSIFGNTAEILSVHRHLVVGPVFNTIACFCHLQHWCL